jgi:hypothetical protein
MILKKTCTLSVFCFMLLLCAKAQRISIDVAGIRNHTQQLNGANFSVFYHFTEMFSAGAEVNRFFTTRRVKENETVQLSVWDFDVNLHHYIALHKKLYVYPVLGVGLATEKEQKEYGTRHHHVKYFNAGAGLLLNTGTIKPHIEYVIASSRKTEQYVLAGVTIEIDFKK